MRKITAIFILAVLIYSPAYSHDFQFSMTQEMINRYLTVLEQETEGGLSDMEIAITGRNQGRFRGKHGIFTIRVNFTFQQPAANQFDIIVDRFSAGILPISKLRFARNLKESLEAVPAIQKSATIQIWQAQDGDITGIRFTFNSSPVEGLPDLSINRIYFAADGRLCVYGDIFKPGDKYVYPITGEELLPDGPRYMYVNVKGANVRTGPSTSYDVITVITLNTRVKAMAMVNNWYRIIIPSSGTEGYISGRLLSDY